MLKEKGYNIDNVSMLDRLAIVGESGMGALTYRPEWDMPKQEKLSSLDELSEQCQKILNTEYSDKLDELYRLGGTSGGARPKIMTKIDDEDWIIKFPAHVDGKNAGLMEYRYSQCAKQCGIDMEETRLFHLIYVMDILELKDLIVRMIRLENTESICLQQQRFLNWISGSPIWIITNL